MTKDTSVQNRSICIANKVESISSIFQMQLPCTQLTTGPWLLDKKLPQRHGFHTLDLSISFSKWQPHLSCSIIQLRLYLSQDLLSSEYELSTIELAASDYNGQAWQFSTYPIWQFSGTYSPSDQGQHQIKAVVNKIYQLFDRS